MTHEVSTHQLDQVSTARGQYYYLVSNNMTHEVSTHQLDQVSTARGQYYYLVSNVRHMRSVHISEAKNLLLEVSTTTLCPII